MTPDKAIQMSHDFGSAYYDQIILSEKAILFARTVHESIFMKQPGGENIIGTDSHEIRNLILQHCCHLQNTYSEKNFPDHIPTCKHCAIHNASNPEAA
jgi:hypothetical protein